MRALLIFALLLVVGCSKPKRGDLIGAPFTFVGVPQALSTNTFQGVDGLKRELVVDVAKVSVGRLGKSQMQFQIRADQPSPLMPGIRYSITAGYIIRHGAVILDYHEAKWWE